MFKNKDLHEKKSLLSKNKSNLLSEICKSVMEHDHGPGLTEIREQVVHQTIRPPLHQAVQVPLMHPVQLN